MKHTNLRLSKSVYYYAYTHFLLQLVLYYNIIIISPPYTMSIVWRW